MNTGDQVMAQAAKLVAAFGRHDTDSYFSFFSTDATFIFYNHPERLASTADYRRLWGEWEADGFRVLSCQSSNQVVTVVSDDAAVFCHDVNTRVSFGSEQEDLAERETIVFARRDGRWVAIHEHLSAQPQGETP